MVSSHDQNCNNLPSLSPIPQQRWISPLCAWVTPHHSSSNLGIAIIVKMLRDFTFPRHQFIGLNIGHNVYTLRMYIVCAQKKGYPGAGGGGVRGSKSKKSLWGSFLVLK